jgi:hypothetical protein
MTTTKLSTTPLSQIAAWWNARPRWQRALLCIVVLVLWGWFDVRRRARTSDVDVLVHKTDLTVYTEAGAAMFDGRNPYEVANPRGWHYLYPPLFAIVMAPLAKLPPTEQALVWYAISLSLVWAGLLETQTLWRSIIHKRQVQAIGIADHTLITMCAAAALAFPVLNCLQRGQVGVLLVCLLLWGARLVLTAQHRYTIVLGGVILALSVAIKLTPLLPAAALCGGLFVGELLFAKRIDQLGRGALSCFGGTIGLALWLFVVPALAVGWNANNNQLQTWVNRVVANEQVGQDNDFNTRGKRNQSFSNGVKRLGNYLLFQIGQGPDDRLVDNMANVQVAMPMETRATQFAVLGCVGLLLVGLAITTIQQAKQPTVDGMLSVFALACMATLVVSPLSWGHHYVLCWPAVVFVPSLFYLNEQPQIGRRFAIAAAMLVLGHYCFLEYTGRVGLLGIGMAMWCCAAVILLIINTHRHNSCDI